MELYICVCNHVTGLQIPAHSCRFPLDSLDSLDSPWIPWIPWIPPGFPGFPLDSPWIPPGFPGFPLDSLDSPWIPGGISGGMKSIEQRCWKPCHQ